MLAPAAAAEEQSGPVEPALHGDMPAWLRDEIVWRLRQGGMAHLFRVGTVDCINRIFEAGIALGREREAAKTPRVEPRRWSEARLFAGNWDYRGRSERSPDDARREIAQALPTLREAGLSFAFQGEPVVRIENVLYG